MKKEISIAQIEQALHEAHDLYRDNHDGKNADYIPYLAGVDSQLFGISVCLTDGHLIEVGDTQYRFGIESVSKVHTAILVLRQYGADKLLSMIGADATGLPFNSIVAILLENDHPSTPLVNAGAISQRAAWCSPPATPSCQVGGHRRQHHPALGQRSRPDRRALQVGVGHQLQQPLHRLAVEKLQPHLRRPRPVARPLHPPVLAGHHRPTAGRLRGHHRQQRESTPRRANRCSTLRWHSKITSLISTVGFYERTGDWLYTSGIPAKSGVGGGILGVLPGVMGISAFAPPIDEAGNSVKAQLAVRYIMNKLGLSVFSGDSVIVSA